MQDTRLIREDLQATLDAHRDLGPAYEAALVESFVARLDATIAARVQAELDARPGPARKPKGNGMVPIALGSLALGIPLTGIAASHAGPAGLVIAWLAIIAVNVAAAATMLQRR
ncbi:hypothetical protein ACWGH8_39090 [Nonomuraea muscovyensis]|uniref:Integral membrane protein n=1 Tax=Nonomuraea muscovyensis TaxID=1124761 RepID=A0A7X0C3D9_9ACTN|nr:hypothetical protein [Nonomuraea muscovyensis]MBB6346906.1 hypothetical protein [Nonomuraea muscovyensis]